MVENRGRLRLEKPSSCRQITKLTHHTCLRQRAATWGGFTSSRDQLKPWCAAVNHFPLWQPDSDTVFIYLFIDRLLHQ